MQYLDFSLKTFFYTLLLAVSVPAFAAESPWLLEAGLNKNELDDPIGRNLSGAVDTGFAQAALVTDGFEKDDSISVGLGYKFGSILGIKVTWMQLDNFESLTTIEIPDFPTSVLNNHEINIEGFNLGLFAELPLSNFFYLRGEIGGFAYNHTINEIFSSPDLAQGVPILVPTANYVPGSNPGAPIPSNQTELFYLPSSVYAGPQEDIENSGTAISASFGALFKFTTNIGVSLDYMLMDNIEDSSVKGLRLGVQYSF
ncbi:MAG: outer membrane beta-barrel protein [Pseudohongiellaceae bacterium]